MRIEDVKNQYYKSAYGEDYTIKNYTLFSEDVVQAIVDEYNISKEMATKIEDIIWDGFSNEMHLYFQKLQELRSIIINIKNQ